MDPQFERMDERRMARQHDSQRIVSPKEREHEDAWSSGPRFWAEQHRRAKDSPTVATPLLASANAGADETELKKQSPESRPRLRGIGTFFPPSLGGDRDSNSLDSVPDLGSTNPTTFGNLLYESSRSFYENRPGDSDGIFPYTIGTFMPEADIETQLSQGIHPDADLLRAGTAVHTGTQNQVPPLDGSPAPKRDIEDSQQAFEDFEAAKAFAAVAIAGEGASGALVTARTEVVNGVRKHYYFATLLRTNQGFESSRLENGRQSLGIYLEGNDYYKQPPTALENMSAIALITTDGRSLDVTGKSVVTAVSWYDQQLLDVGSPEADENRFPGIENPQMPEIIAAEGYDAVLSNVRSVAGEGEGAQRVLNKDGYKALFLGLLQSRALRQLEKNRQEVESEKEKWKAGGTKATDKNYRQLQEAVEKDDEVQERIRELERTIDPLSPDIGVGAPVDPLYSQEEIERRESEREWLLAVRQAAFQTEPVIGLLDSDDVSSGKIVERLNDVLEVIAAVEQAIYARDMPILEFGPLLQEVLLDMDPVGRQEMVEYVKEQKQRELNASLLSLLRNL
ncbi:MAG: hypothetical protein AAGC93_29790, partial [Cyanobacteria bacterium P01_F01_bin.53]